MTLQVPEAREDMALVKGFRGDVLVWLRTGTNGGIERCHLRDPVAAARGCHRGQHRCRLSPVQQILQLLVLGP